MNQTTADQTVDGGVRPLKPFLLLTGPVGLIHQRRSINLQKDPFLFRPATQLRLA